MVGAFLSLGRVLPDSYPLLDDLDTYLVREHSLGRMLDYGVIGPRIQALYDWSARELNGSLAGFRAPASPDATPLFRGGHGPLPGSTSSGDSSKMSSVRVLRTPGME